MIIDKNKKGTIILSHYRSGGTQLKSIITTVIGNEMPFNYIGEIDFDENKNDFKEQFESQMHHEGGIYNIILLNNPVVISFLYSTNRFEKLKEEYNIIMLERKNKENVLLSLPLWQHLINEGLFVDVESQTPENMKIFHDKMLNKIEAEHIYLGTHLPITVSPSIEWMNTILRIFTYEIQMIHSIQKEYQLTHVYYEEFESKEKMIQFKDKYFKDSSDSNLINKLIKTIVKTRYHSKNYVDYYEPVVGKMMKVWNIDKL